MFCPKCNTTIEPETKICPVCGKTLHYGPFARILAVLGVTLVILINAALIIYLYWNI